MMYLFEKGWEYWIAVVSAALYVWQVHSDTPWFTRLVIVASSSGIGVSTGGELAKTFGTGEKITTVATITLCWLALGVAASVIQNRKDFIDKLLSYKGGK